MTTLTDTQVITASGGLVELGYVARTSDQSVTATSFGAASEVFSSDLSFVADGSTVIVEFSSPYVGAASTAHTTFFYLSDGSSTQGVLLGSVGLAAGYGGPQVFRHRYTPSAGAVTLNVRAYVDSGSTSITGSTGTGTASVPTLLRVSKIVTATQWPAVTTATVVCTSSTRPASPFEGQAIYETDTDLTYTYSGTAWVATGNLGAWTAWTPSVYQNGTKATTNTLSRYTRSGRTITYEAVVTVTAAGTAGQPLTWSLPVAAANPTSTQVVGTFSYFRASGTRYTGTCLAHNGFGADVVNQVSGTSNQLGIDPSFATANGDLITYSGTYEAAS